MSKSKLEKVQLIIFFIIVLLAFIFRGNGLVFYILFGSYYLFVIISEISKGIVSLNCNDELKNTGDDYSDKKMSLSERLINFGGYAFALILWYNLTESFIPDLDQSKAQGFYFLGHVVPLASTLIAVMIIMHIIYSAIELFIQHMKLEFDEHESSSTMKDLVVKIGLHIIGIVIAVIITLGGFYVSFNWCKVVTEEEIIIKYIWNEKQYSWDSMISYEYDVDSHTLKATFEDNEKIRIKLDSILTSTDAVNKRYGRYLSFVDYLFCEKYTYIDHEIL